MGQFDFFSKIGATDEAVAVLNDQPELFTYLLVVILGIAIQIGVHWYIHYATLKPSQKKTKEKKDDKKAAAPTKPNARR